MKPWRALFGSAFLALALAAQAPRLDVGVNDPVSAAIPDDPDLARVIAPLAAEIQASFGRVIAQAPRGMVRFQAPGECPLGFLLADAMRAGATAATGAEVRMAFTNSGGVRRDLPAGPVHVGDLYEVSPFDIELVVALAEARFPILNCNLDTRAAPALGARLRPWLVRALPGVKVGLTGVCVDFQGLVARENHLGVDWRDPVARLRLVLRHLREVEKVDLVVLLSHLGFDRQGEAVDDLNLARLVPGIDVIIGGHTHTFLEAPRKVANAAGETEIFQVGFAGVNLGRMDVTVRQGLKVAASGSVLPVLG